MKKIIVSLMSFMTLILPVYADNDKITEDYLKNKKHFAIMNPIAENVAQRAIKKALVKETKGKYKVRFDGYTLSSMKEGVFKNLEVTGKNIIVEDIEIPYLKMETVSDYNRIGYNKNPVEILTDMTFYYEMHLSEKSINEALQTKEYQKKIKKVNKIAYPLFTLCDVKVKLKDGRIYTIMEYNSPIKPIANNRTFVVSNDINIVNNKIKLSNIAFNKAYGNLPIDKVANLVNLVDPLSFTLNLFDNKKCDGRIDSIKIEDDIVKVDGKIYVKADGSK